MNIKKLYQNYSLNTYTRVGPVFVRGKGSWLWDSQGNKYLDLLPGWGVSILGHCHPAIAKATAKQAKKLIHLPNNLFFPEQALLAKKIAALSFPAKVFFANSGAEGIEAAIKLSRLFGKGRRYEVIIMKNSFHGRTFGALSATAQSKYKKPFKPILAGFKEAAFNDMRSFKAKVTKKTVAVLLELIQGEGGVNVADRKYIKQLRGYCQKHNILFMVDEVQTGMGRTGKLFCYQHYSITPDIMILSKGLGAGLPISAIVVNKKIADIIKPGMHASTFGGSPLVTRASLETFKLIDQQKLLSKVKENGDYLYQQLCSFKKKYPFIQEVRGKGLMLGVELSIEAQPLFLECLKRKLIVNATHKTVLRVLPALNVTKPELDKGLKILETVFEDLGLK